MTNYGPAAQGDNRRTEASADTLRSGIELLASAHGVTLNGELLSQLLADARGDQ